MPNPIVRALLVVESAWWMTRIFMLNINIWPAFMGWAAALSTGRHHAPIQDVVLLALACALSSGSLFIVNDILDEPGDRVTAPYLPLPSRLLTRSAAWCWAGVYLVAALVMLVFASRTPSRFLIAIGMAVGASIASICYSKAKADGIIASVIITGSQCVPAGIAWIFAGGGAWWALTLVLAYCVLSCISNNILAALRDVDLDESVGNITVAVRMGAPVAFRTAAALGFVAAVPVVTLSIVAQSWTGLPYLAVGCGVMAYSYGRTYRTMREPDRGRVTRMGDMKAFKTGEFWRHAAVVAVFSPWLALAAGVVMFVALRGGGLVYAARMVRGGLRAQLDRLAEASGPTPVRVEAGLKSGRKLEKQ